MSRGRRVSGVLPGILPPEVGPGLSGGASERRAPYPGAGGCHRYAGPSAFQVLPAGYKDGIKRIYVPAAGPEGQADAGTYGYAGVGGGGSAGIYRSILFFAFF